MGIFCEINLHKSGDGAFTPGSVVQGTIKYCFDEETEFKRITVSLKGSGSLTMTPDKKDRMTHTNQEEYINEKHVIHDKDKGVMVFPIGSYETRFCFKLPEKIPCTLNYREDILSYEVRCNIDYFIQIKFVRSGFMKFDKRFKKEITVVSNITPRLPNIPIICGEQKTLTQWFSSKKSIVNIKATIQTCVLKPGDTINFDYEITNNTNIDVKGVETKLLEKYTFISYGDHKDYDVKEVKNTESKTGSIKSGERQDMSVEIPIPSDLSSIDCSKIVMRDYIVRITAILKAPHRNFWLEIPVQIGDVDVQAVNDAPPSYWEAMNEDDNEAKTELCQSNDKKS